jgi:putative ABC transport system substrate-binding protein
MNSIRLWIAILAVLCMSSTQVTAQTQRPSKAAQIGVLVNSARGPRFDEVSAQLVADLGKLGHVEGRDIRIEPRFADDKLDRLPELAAELVSLQVDVILCLGGVPAAAAMKATSTIPVVFLIVTDPVALGLARSYERPGGNATGVTSLDPEQPGKQIALLKELVPKLERLALLSDPTLPGADASGMVPLERDLDAAARAAGVRPFLHKVKGPDPALAAAFEDMMKQRVEAILVLETPVALSHRKQIVELATARRLPTLFPPRPADPASVAIFGTNFGDVYQYVPRIIDKILKGTKPGDIPVQVITRSELVINLKTAAEIGLPVAPELVARAVRVVR